MRHCAHMQLQLHAHAAQCAQLNSACTAPADLVLLRICKLLAKAFLTVCVFVLRLTHCRIVVAASWVLCAIGLFALLNAQNLSAHMRLTLSRAASPSCCCTFWMRAFALLDARCYNLLSALAVSHSVMICIVSSIHVIYQWPYPLYCPVWHFLNVLRRKTEKHVWLVLFNFIHVVPWQLN